jgi:hypothetical protein
MRRSHVTSASEIRPEMTQLGHSKTWRRKTALRLEYEASMKGQVRKLSFSKCSTVLSVFDPPAVEGFSIDMV